MKITICGSLSFYKEMTGVQQQLQNLGHEVKLTEPHIKDKNGDVMDIKDYDRLRRSEKNNDSWIWAKKNKEMRLFFKKIEWCDAIIVLNYDKNNIANYIGGNAFMEMGIAFYLDKKIFLLNNIPEMAYCKEEIVSMKPAILNGNLTKIQ